MPPHCLPTVHWGPKRPLQGLVASQGVHHLPLQQQWVFQTKRAALTLDRRVAVQGEAVRAGGEVLRSPRLLEDSSWGSRCHTLNTPHTAIVTLKACPVLRGGLQLQELLGSQTAPAGEVVHVVGDRGMLVLDGGPVVVVDLGQPDQEERGAAEGDDQDGHHQQLGPVLLQDRM